MTMHNRFAADWVAADGTAPRLPRLSIFEVLGLLGKASPMPLDPDLEQSVFDDHEWEETICPRGYCRDDE